LLRKKRTAAWIFFILALLVKPMVVLLAPFFLLEVCIGNDRRAWGSRALELASHICLAVLAGWVVAFPFFTDHAIYDVYSRIYGIYASTASIYPHITNQAFNIYAWNGNFDLPDTARVLFVSLKTWGVCAFLGLFGLFCGQYARLRDERALLEACFLVFLAFFLVPTEMHERYIVYALAFAPILAVLDRAYIGGALSLMLVGWMNMYYAIHATVFIPVFVRLCIATNVLAFLFVAYRFLKRAIVLQPIPNAPTAGEHGERA
jgi:Gpi18-like mannosyltransferase